MNSLSHALENSNKKTSSMPKKALVAFLWLAIFALNILTNVHDIREFYRAHIFITIYLCFVIFLLYIYAKADNRNLLLLVYGITYITFHFGIVPVYSVAPDKLEELGFGLIWWYHNLELVMKAYFSAAVFLSGLVTSIIIPIKTNIPNRLDGVSSIKLARISLIGLLLGILSWISITSSAGIGAYDKLLQMLAEDALTGIIGIVHTVIGMTFIVAVMDSSTRRKAILLYGFWSILAFSSGLRGEVAFPAVMALGLLGSQGVLRITMTRMLVGSGVFLALSSGVAQTRISTSGAAFLDSVSVAKGVVELGGSIRPSYEVMSWLEKGDTFMLGETYYAPFERFFLRILPLWERLPASEDYRLMNILIGERAGPYGFSISAEAFYNFGYLGVAVVGVLTGFAMRYLGQKSISKNLPILLFSLSFALFIHIRQDFVTAWAGMLYGTLIMASLHLIASRKRYG